MKVCSYLNVIPQRFGNNRKMEKIDIIKKYPIGVNQHPGDTGYVYDGYDIQPVDVAVIQGWQHSKGKKGRHLQLRQDIIDTQRARGKATVAVDANLFLYANASNEPHHYLRYSFNGIFPTTGIYCDTEIDPKRWQQISTDCNIHLDDYKRKGKHILLCCQRNGGWSMGEYDLMDWIEATVKEIRKYSDRPVVVRPHPGDVQGYPYLKSRHSRLHRLLNVSISPKGRSLQEDLAKAWCVVNHNSSSIVGPIIMGYRAFITDPSKSQCSEVTNHDFSKIEKPEEFDRQAWLERISMFHWKFSELEDGSCWRHMRKYLNF
jgi:hypothetical protein